MNWVILIVVGGILGWLASILMKTNAQMGLVANVVVGICGSLLGSQLAPMIGLVPTDTVGYYLVAFGGAVLLIVILRRLGFFK